MSKGNEKTNGSEILKKGKKRTIKDYLEKKIPTEQKKPQADELEMSEVVTSEEGNIKLIVVGNDVVGLFPYLLEKETGGTVANQSMKIGMGNAGRDYMEMARYCAINRHLCGDLSEVENLLPWRTN